MKQLLKQSWNRFIALIQKNPSHCIIYGLMLTLSSSLVFISGNILQLTNIAQKNPQFAMVFQVIVLCISTALILILVISMVRFLARLHQKNSVRTIQQELSEAVPFMIPAFLIIIMYNIIVFGGFLLLLIPGFIFSIWYFFSFFGVALENKGIRESLSYSKKLVQGRAWSLFFILILFNILLGLAGKLLTNILNILLSVTLRATIPPLGIFILTLVTISITGTILTVLHVGFVTSLYTIFKEKTTQ